MRKRILFTLLTALTLSGCGAGEQAPSLDDKKVSDLKATGIDQGIVLTWKSDDAASSYVVYKDNSIYKEVENNYYTITNLDNDQTYNLGVALKNEGGISEVTYIEAKPDASKDYDPFIEDLNTSLEKRITKNKIQSMFVEADLNNVNTDTTRLKRVINKMKSGEKQTIAYVGGSISVGEKATALDDNKHQKGYAYYSYSWLKEHYDKNNNSKFINASISGTDTSIASVRLEKDVLQYSPDLVFVEFAANNGTSLFDKKTYESLIKRILLEPQAPAVVLLFSATEYSKNHQDLYMKPIGEHYRLPMLSFVNAMNAVCSNLSPNLTDPIFKAFTPDGVHPNDQGHKLYAKVLASTLKKLINSSDNTTEYTVKSSPWQNRGDDYINMKFINNQNGTDKIKNLGSFVASDTSYRVLKETADVEAYQNGWKKTVTNANVAMEMELTCKSFFIIYLAGNSYVPGDPKGNMIASYQNVDKESDKGQLKWDVERTMKQSSLTTVVDNGNGWDNPCCMILLDNEVAAKYNISIKMENTNELGTLLAFGYCE